MKFNNAEFVNESLYTEYHSNGQISGKGDIVGGREECRKTGPWIYYYENGQKKSEGVYDTHFYQHNHGGLLFAIKKGKWTYWYPKGALLALGAYDGCKEIDNKYFTSDVLPFATAKRAPNWQYYDLQGRPVTKEYLNEKGIFIEDK